MTIKHAQTVAARSTCDTRPCGAVLTTVDNTVVTGYEGAPRGQLHCSVIGCGALTPNHTCSRAVPAELNALLEAARRGVSTVGATLYISASPVPAMIGAIINAGVRTVVYVGHLAPDLQEQLTHADIHHVQHLNT